MTLRSFGGRRIGLWALPLAVVLANLGWLLVFGSGARVRATELARLSDRSQHEHNAVAARLAQREKLWITATENRNKIERLYQDRFSTQAARFTNTVRELKSLARRAGLDPRAIGYPEEKLEDFELTRRSFVFSVGGNYSQLRTFLHLVELSNAFFTVRRIEVSESGNGLSIRLSLATFFAAAAPATAAPAPTVPADGAAAAPVPEPSSSEGQS